MVWTGGSDAMARQGSGRFFPALLAMSACHAVLLTPSISLRLTQALSCTQIMRETPLIPFYVFNSLRTLSFSVSCNLFVCHSYENCRGVYQQFPIWNSLLSNLHSPGGRTRACPRWRACSPLTKSCPPRRATFSLRFHLSPFLSSSCTLFCAFLHSPETQPFYFQPIPHSLRKIPGVEGEGSIGLSNQRFFYPRFTLCPALRPSPARRGEPPSPPAPPCGRTGPGVHSIRIRQECRQSHVALHVGR